MRVHPSHAGEVAAASRDIQPSTKTTAAASQRTLFGAALAKASAVSTPATHAAASSHASALNTPAPAHAAASSHASALSTLPATHAAASSHASALSTPAATQPAASTHASTAKAARPESVLDSAVPPKGETSSPIAGAGYADILSGPRNGMFLNTSGNSRTGRAFVLVKQPNGRELHIYGTGKHRLVIECKSPVAPAATTDTTGAGGTAATGTSGSTGAAATGGTTTS